MFQNLFNCLFPQNFVPQQQYQQQNGYEFQQTGNFNNTVSFFKVNMHINYFFLLNQFVFYFKKHR